MAPVTGLAKLSPIMHRRWRTGDLPGIGVDQPPVLVEPRMSDPLCAVTDAGNLVSGHVAPGCQIERHAWGRRTAQVEAGSAQPDSSLAGCRPRSDGPGPPHLP